jgi:ATP-dependent DNA helicase PIF1
MLLTQVKRQKDKQFINLLEEIRFGKCSEATISLLEKQKNIEFKCDSRILPTILCTHKDDVGLINKKELKALNTNSYEFKSIDTCDNSSIYNFKNYLNNMCPVDELIELKINAQVLLAKNLDVNKGLVNGSRGFVAAFTETKLPIIRFVNGIELTIKYDTWSFKMNSSGSMVYRRQLPLQLAWAISIHKSQGMTLDCVEISLLRVFECGQAYVALSRAKSLENLRIIDFNKNAIRANDVVLKFYKQIEKNKNLDETIGDIDDI